MSPLSLIDDACGWMGIVNACGGSIGPSSTGGSFPEKRKARVCSNGVPLVDDGRVHPRWPRSQR
jgi:hypothetical protein